MRLALETNEFLEDIDNLTEFIDQSSNKKLDDETIICECFCVNVADIKALSLETIDFKILRDTFGLGTGCTSCIKNMDSWREKI